MTQCNFFNYLFFKPFVSERSSYLHVDFFFKKQHLKAIGIKNRGHRKRLLIEIEKLPQIEIPQEVPVSHFTHLHVVLGNGGRYSPPPPPPPPRAPNDDDDERRRRRRTTTTTTNDDDDDDERRRTTSHNMAAIQLIPSHAVLDYSIYR